MLLLTEGVKQMIGSITQSSPLLIYMVHERGDGHVSKTSLGKGWKKKKKVQTRTKLEMNWRLFECASKNTYCKLDPPVTTKPMVPWLTRVLAVLCLKKKDLVGWLDDTLLFSTYQCVTLAPQCYKSKWIQTVFLCECSFVSEEMTEVDVLGEERRRRRKKQLNLQPFLCLWKKKIWICFDFVLMA